MTFSSVLTVLLTSLLFMLAALYAIRSKDAPLRIELLDIEGSNELEYALERSPLSGMESELMCIITAALVLMLLPLHAILAVNAALLVISSAADFRDHEIPLVFLLCIFLMSCAIGLSSGMYMQVLLCTAVFCIYEVTVSDSSVFGAGDVYALLSCYAMLGFFMGSIATIITCVVGVVMKLLLWLFKIDKKENRGIPFVPAITCGTIAGYILKNVYSDVISYLRFEDIVWYIQHR